MTPAATTKPTVRRAARTASAAALFAALLVAAGGAPRPAWAEPPTEPPAPAASPTGAAAAPAQPVPDATGTGDNPQPPPPTRRPRLRVGPEIGFFLPTDDKTRARFGSTWVTFGIGFGSVLSRAQSQGQFLLDLDVYTRSRSGNRAVIVPIGVQYRRSLIGGGGGGDLADRSSFVPYVGASANLVVVSLRVPDEDIDSTRVTAGAGVALGAMVGEAGYAEARYLFTGRTLGYDTSGFTVSVGLRF